MPTRTGFDPLFAGTGQSYANELFRQAHRVLAELGAEPSAGIPSTLAILRDRLTVAPDTARGIPGTYARVPGLTGLSCALFLPDAWRDDTGTAPGTVLKETQRVVAIMDIPATATEAADTLLPSDRLELTDPVFGAVVFKVVEVLPIKQAGVIHARIEYSRETK